jgi:hypothetical protein
MFVKELRKINYVIENVKCDNKITTGIKNLQILNSKF